MSRTLLIVDDIKTNREILKNILGREYSILEAEHGQEALAIMTAEYQTISAVLLDLGMPVMDGFEVLSYMQSSETLSQLPVIVTTGQTDASSEEKALKLGAKDYISKPYKSTIIKQRIWNTINLRETAATVNALQRDRLTGLLSRDAFFEKVSEMVLSREPGYYTMACFDVNRFKIINDQYGVAKGDEVLRYIAQTFSKGFEAVGGVVSRVSSDDFAVLYPTAFQKTEEIALTRKKASKVEGLASPLAFTIGRYTVADTSMQPSAMYDRAMLAAESVKGRYDTNIACYTEAMRDRLIREQEIVTEMESALAKRQFEVWFQPQYNHSTGAIIGAEALVRWRHPRKGMIQPSVFVPVFEQNGFIYTLDRFVWEEACRFLREEISAGRSPLPISVNISRYDVFREGFVGVITDLVAKYELPVSLLRLEITESAFAESTSHIVKVVKELISLGFTLEIDDFGSGYSSLNTLKSVPAQVVKLDMRFLEDDDDSQRGGNIIESIVRMTKWLGMSVIAEGVERRSQADYLSSIGCNYVQGYLYARPMTESDYRQLCSDSGKEEKLLALETVENLDNNMFWNPDSTDTLIFNSYVGGACIYEYYRGNIELVRASEKYAQLMSEAGMSLENALKLDWMAHLDEESAERMRADIEKSIATRNEVTGEYVYIDLPDCPPETYFRSTMRVIASAGDRFLLYCTNENISAQRQSEQRERQVAAEMRLIMENVNSGICATEYLENGDTRLFFANDKYYSMYGYTKEQFEAELGSPLDTIYSEDREKTLESVGRLIKSHGTGALEFRCVKRDGTIINVNSNVCATSFAGTDNDVLLSVLRDVTELTLTRQKEKRLSEQMQAIMDNVDLGIVAAVVEDDLPHFVFANERYFEILGYTREQYESEIKSPFEIIAPEDRTRVIAERRLLNLTGEPRTVVFNAVRRDGSICTLRSAVSMGSLSGISERVQLSITRDITEEMQTEQRERAAALQLASMMDDMPGGYVRMSVSSDGALKPVYFNVGFRQLVDMDNERLMEFYSEDPFEGVHPDDVAALTQTVAKMLEMGEAKSARYRLKRGDGDYIWLSVFGRVTSDDAGERFLNVYYTDASEEVREEEAQKELLDNLPGGAALYEYENGRLSVVHLNRSYWELVGSEPTEYSGDSPISAVHPDDVQLVMRELESAIEQKRDVRCDIRLLNEKTGYILVRLVGRIIPAREGRYSIYISFSPVSNDAVSYQQTLPLLLGAIMDSTTDLSFAKDSSLRYISASRTFVKLVGKNSADELIGKSDYDLFEKELADKYRRDDETVLASGRAIVDKIELIPSDDGTPSYSKTSKYILRDAFGEMAGLYGVGRDVTESFERDSQLMLVNDSIPGGLASYLCTPGEFSSENIKLTYFNDGFCGLFGFTREEYENRAAVDPTGMILTQDRHLIAEQWKKMMESGKPARCTYRVRTKDSGYKWIDHRATVTDHQGDKVAINTILMDVTEQRELIEQLRISEEENNLAVLLGGSLVCRYTIADRSLKMSSGVAEAYSMPERIENVPYEPVRLGMISPETAGAYIDFFEKILSGVKTAGAIFQQRYLGEWRWMQAKSSTVFANSGRPVKAVISILDITDRLEKETAYKKWQQSLEDKNPESYTLYRCNLNNNSALAFAEGELIGFDFAASGDDFNKRNASYAESCVFEEDKEAYRSFIDSDSLLAGYHRGKRSDELEYRETLPEGEYRWLRLTVDLVENPNSAEVEAYLMFEDIDKPKREALKTRALAETDALTGLLNRSSFTMQVERSIGALPPETHSALLMLDIDGFKRVNDVFGHSVGDKVLVATANALRSTLRPQDLVCRLGGDEFMIFLADVANDAVAAARARQICALTRKALSAEVEISGSIGIAVCPRDGTDFDTLYKKSDAALYLIKGSGKDSYAFYNDDMADEHLSLEKETQNERGFKERRKKRRMLIVDDSEIDHIQLASIFSERFIVERAKDGNSALVRLRNYGSAISVVLLDLVMPGMDGFEVLKRMQESAELASIPVIVVSGDDDRETGLRAIREGAVDFVSKPIDPDILRIRVHSVISKADNRRLRAENTLLEFQNSEVVRYKTALERNGIVVVEHDWVDGSFSYDSLIGEFIAGTYDKRGLWQILLSDKVASAEAVQQMQETVHKLAADRTVDSESALVELKTPSGDFHRFRMNIFKEANEFGLTDRIYMTFVDLGAEQPE